MYYAVSAVDVRQIRLVSDIPVLHSFKHERKAPVTYGNSKGLLSRGYISSAEREAPIAEQLPTK